MFQIALFGGSLEQIPSEMHSMDCQINLYSYDAEKIMDLIEPSPNLILCFPSTEMLALEVAQTLRMNYPEAPLFFITSQKKDFDKKKLIKNGFTGAYLLPWEKADLLRSLKEEAVYSTQPELREYRPIKVVDLEPEMVIEFGINILLSKNNKFLPFARAGEPISSDKIGKLNENNMNTLFVHKDEIGKFHQYTAEKFKKLLKPNMMSETEKQEKLEFSVRELISDMFIEDARENTFGKSQSLLKEVKEVIKILLADENADLISKIGVIINQEDNFYQHLTNVSTYAGIFAIILKFEKPEEMALAGLLHDIGKINLPLEIADIDISRMSKDSLAAYKNHPKYTLDVARLTRLVIPDKVATAITQHHEAMNGSGYPAGIDSTRISPEGRLLAIANTFDHLTAMKPGEANLTMAQALIKMHEDNSSDPGRMILDITMIKKLKEFLLKK